MTIKSKLTIRVPLLPNQASELNQITVQSSIQFSNLSNHQLFRKLEQSKVPWKQQGAFQNVI